MINNKINKLFCEFHRFMEMESVTIPESYKRDKNNWVYILYDLLVSKIYNFIYNFSGQVEKKMVESK